jgi:hypothetical protein
VEGIFVAQRHDIFDLNEVMTSLRGKTKEEGESLTTVTGNLTETDAKQTPLSHRLGLLWYLMISRKVIITKLIVIRFANIISKNSLLCQQKKTTISHCPKIVTYISQIL